MPAVEQQFVNGLVLGSIYTLLALGYTLIFGVLDVIFFAQGELAMVGAFVSLGCFVIAERLSLPEVVTIPLALLAAAVVCILVAVLCERLALRPIRQAHRTKQLIASLGVSIVLQNIVFLTISSGSIAVPQLPVRIYHLADATITNIELLVVATSVVLMAVLNAFVRYSRAGLKIRATAESSGAAALFGIDVDRTIAATFALGAVLAAGAGLMMALYDGVVKYDMGFLPGIKGFTAAVLGGLGNVRGAMLGGLILGMVEAFGAGFVSSDNRHLFAFLSLVAILVFRPAGILGESSGRRAR